MLAARYTKFPPRVNGGTSDTLFVMHNVFVLGGIQDMGGWFTYAYNVKHVSM